MLPVQNLFAGGAMNPTAGMAMNPLLQGFGAYQNMQNDFTDRGLNQQSQDIQNQTSQHALDQLRAGDPLAEATRQRDLGVVGIDQSQIDSGQALATRQAADKAKQSKSYTDMSNDAVQKEENKRHAVVDVAQNMQDPDYLMKPEMWQADKKILESHGAKGLPDVADHQTIQSIQRKAAQAPDDLKEIRSARAAKLALEGKMAEIKLQNEGALTRAEAQAKIMFGRTEMTQPDDAKILNRADMMFKSSHTLTEDTYAQAYASYESKFRADPAITKAAGDATTRLGALSEKELPAAIESINQALGTDIKGKDRTSIIADADTKIPDALVKAKTKQALATRFPNADIVDGNGKKIGTVSAAPEGPKALSTPVTPPVAPPASPGGAPLAARDASLPLPPGGGPQTPPAVKENPRGLPIAGPETWKNAKKGEPLWNAQQQREVER